MEKRNHIYISHEVPLSLMEQSLQFNDYDYCLIHLLEKYPQYKEFFKQNSAVRQISKILSWNVEECLQFETVSGVKFIDNIVTAERMTIMDNSAYELGASLNDDLIIKCAEMYQPNLLIAPDIMHDAGATIERTKIFVDKWADVRNKHLEYFNGESLQRNFFGSKNIEFEETIQLIGKYNLKNITASKKTIREFASDLLDAIKTSGNKADVPHNPNLTSLMGVVQGKSLRDFEDCIKEYNKMKFTTSWPAEPLSLSAIAFNFASPLYSSEELEDINDDFKYLRKRSILEKRTYGRPIVINWLYDQGLIQDGLYYHLLGCNLPQEGVKYQDPKFNFIKSIDTSNPILHAMHGEQYTVGGLLHKRSELLADMMEIPYNDIDQDILQNNVKLFKYFWNRNISGVYDD